MWPGWFGAWLAAFGGRGSILALRRGERLAAVLPLVRRAGALRSATNWHTPLFGPVAEDDAALRELAQAALGERASRLDLAFIDPAGAATEAFRAAACVGTHPMLSTKQDTSCQSSRRGATGTLLGCFAGASPGVARVPRPLLRQQACWSWL